MAIAVATEVNVPHVIGAVGVRGAEPPDGVRAVQVCNTLVQRRRTGPRLKVVQFRAIRREVGVVAGCEANLVAGQQENLTEQAVSTALVSATRTTVLTVRNLHLLDSVLDVTVEQIQERVIQVGVDVAAFVLIYIGTVPLSVLIDVLHQQPRSIAAYIIDAGRQALMYY